MRVIPILLLGLLSLVWPSGRVLAQASFALQNHWPSAGIDAPVFDWTGSLLSGTEWRVELYGGAAPDALSPAMDWYNRSRVIIPLSQPGYFFSWNGALSVLDVPGYDSAWLQVKVWDVGLGATYEQASARGLGGYGESALFYAQGSYPGGSVVSPPAPLIGLESFSVLQETPEPSTWALLLLGGAGMWWCRRRS
jgi:hypothetical protein